MMVLGASQKSSPRAALALVALSLTFACAVSKSHQEPSTTSQAQAELSAVPTGTAPKANHGTASRIAPIKCPRFAEGRALYTVSDRALSEISGIAASHQVPGLLWAHNDSGDDAKVYGLIDGELRVTAILSDIQAIDFEDIALVSHAGVADQLYLADTGDNTRIRSEVSVYRINAPPVTTDSVREIPATTVERVHVHYPDGPQDVEALMVDPQTQDLYLIHKGRIGENYVYGVENPAMHGEHVKAKKVATLKLGLVTAADISQDGRAIVVRTYLDVLFWQREGQESIVDALSRPPCSLPHADEPQGESIAFSADGSHYFTVSEGVHAPIYDYRRLP